HTETHTHAMEFIPETLLHTHNGIHTRHFVTHTHTHTLSRTHTYTHTHTQTMEFIPDTLLHTHTHTHAYTHTLEFIPDPHSLCLSVCLSHKHTQTCAL